MIRIRHETFQRKRLKMERYRYGFKRDKRTSLSILNEIVPFSSVYTTTFHAIFKSCRFQSRLHLMPATKRFSVNGGPKRHAFATDVILKRYTVNGPKASTKIMCLVVADMRLFARCDRL